MELRAFAETLPSGSFVLDAGAGDCRYSSLFDKHLYESADFAQVKKAYGKLNYICDLTRIPVEDARFDAIICTQVLAHLPAPALALAEMRRILKPNGKFFIPVLIFFRKMNRLTISFDLPKLGYENWSRMQTLQPSESTG